MDKAGGPPRIWEIDFLRGLSVVLMVCYHLLFQLGEFHGVKRFLGFSTDLTTFAWTTAQHFFAGLFVVLSGVSGTLSRSNLKRGLRLLLVSLAVTAATYIFDSSSAVYFGILQCLAVSMIVYGAAFRTTGPAACAVWGGLVIGSGIGLRALMKGVTVSFDWLMPFGITSPSFGSFDYFPLFPWLGIFLIGAALGKSAYASRRSLLPWSLPRTFVNWVGRHALIIYLAHPLIIWGALSLLIAPK